LLNLPTRHLKEHLMKASLSAIALGALLACNFATAQTITITQQGTGNDAYAEQQGPLPGPGFNPAATIIQIGNNNHAGDPVSRTPGIVQRDRHEFAAARILQNGNENTASIVQDGVAFTVNAIIEQVGTGNTAGLRQHIQTGSNGSLRQTGTNNVATLDQEFVADSGFSAAQTGSDNRLSVRQRGTVLGPPTVPPTVEQTGSGNSVTLDVERLFITSMHIEQVGSMNTVNSTVLDGDDIGNSIRQNGTGNTAVTNQVGRLAIGSSFRSVITQNGNNNLASLMQVGQNDSLIKQVGNDNSATVAQTYIGPCAPNTAYIKQIGNGFTASLTQTGAGNNAGIYQH
jgi:hypothetical protein